MQKNSNAVENKFFKRISMRTFYFHVSCSQISATRKFLCQPEFFRSARSLAGHTPHSGCQNGGELVSPPQAAKLSPPPAAPMEVVCTKGGLCLPCENVFFLTLRAQKPENFSPAAGKILRKPCGTKVQN